MTNTYVISSGELYHYGVKGMKWGVHKARVSKSQLIKDARVRSSELKKQRQSAIDERDRFYDNIDPDNDYDNRVRDWAKLKPLKQQQLDRIDATIRSLEREIFDTDKIANQRTAGEKAVDALTKAGALAATVASIAAVSVAGRSLSKTR